MTISSKIQKSEIEYWLGCYMGEAMYWKMIGNKPAEEICTKAYESSLKDWKSLQ